ncbi:serine/threonine-protein kinase [Nonomuraea pusilla]|uniref:non-specific serine/threonine protein kinase n=1 Tax=Nonomuraea pusilla TaxID=46177 RepID=A0A1H8GTS0_9ACTN|nr:serine/threonine-protein kinase [Nonomuraea pusilla]SEN46877.1 serine/threonine protein kinase [Nonomuraea pusilla]
MLGAGTTLNDRYVLADRIGGGGMGEVWRADDTVLGRTVAVKVLMPALTESPTFTQRFLNEARAMATLRHPGVVDVYDYGTSDVGGRRVSFLVMEYVPGESLDQVLRRGPLGPEAAMLLVAQVADALAAAHAQGIVHRDVKPANLMVRPDGGVALTDFGIAHSVSAGHLTATGTMLCSAGYCAPEMATASEVTPAVDVYALGVVAYECLTGELPFQGDTPVQIIFKHLNSPVPRLPRTVPPGPRQVVERAMDKAPDRRWASAAQMAEAARKAVASPAALPAPRRHRTMTALLSMTSAVAVTSAVAGWVWLRPVEPAAQVETPATVSATTAPVPAPSSPVTPGRQQPRPGRSTPGPKPGGTVTAPPSATPSATPTASPSDPSPTAEPTTDKPTDKPTQEPTGEPTQEPTKPGTDEPTSEPTATEVPGETP